MTGLAITLLEASWVKNAVGGSMLLALPVAALAGLLSFFSPCVLPLLPGYLSFATGLSAAEVTEAGRHRWRTLLGTALFVLGFAAVFVTTGAIAGGLGFALLRHQRGISIGIGVICIVVGLIFAGVLPMGRRDLRIHRVPRVGLVAAPLLGVVFGLGWTPCIGPALSVVLSLCVNQASATRGGVLAFAYALGLGIPFVLAGQALVLMNRSIGLVKRHMGFVQRLGGALMVLVGVLLVTGWWDALMAHLRVWAAGVGAPI